MALPRDRYVTFAQPGPLRLRYWDVGRAGTPVLLIHGLGSYCEVWEETVAALAPEHRVVVLDLPGHGLSTKLDDYSYRVTDLAAVVRLFLLALGIRRVHLIGHSLGGAIAAHLALQSPVLVDRLLLVASAGFGSGGSWTLRLATLPGLGEWLMRPSLSRSASAARALLTQSRAATPERIRLHYEMAAQPGAVRSALKTARANGSLWGQRPELVHPILRGGPQLTNPTLVLWGANDQILPVHHAHIAGRVFRDVEVHVLPACGHIPMLEHSMRCHQLFLRFLSDHPSPARAEAAAKPFLTQV